MRLSRRFITVVEEMAATADMRLRLSDLGETALCDSLVRPGRDGKRAVYTLLAHDRRQMTLAAPVEPANGAILRDQINERHERRRRGEPEAET